MSPPIRFSAQHPSLVPPARLPLALRLLAVKALQSASAVLARSAARLATAQQAASRATAPPCIEFHAEAGALEGALYVDGRLVAHLPGVRRL